MFNEMPVNYEASPLVSLCVCVCVYVFVCRYLLLLFTITSALDPGS